MNATSLLRASLLVGAATVLGACGFSARPTSGKVACNPGGGACCPDGYLCVGRGAVTAEGVTTGTCWDRKDLPPEALLAPHDYTPGVAGDPACLVTDWLPPGSVVPVDSATADAPYVPTGPDGGATALDGAADTTAPTDGGADQPLATDATGPRDDAGRDAPSIDGSGVDGTSIIDGASGEAGGGEAGSSDAPTTVARRLPLPCGAALPTGFCIVSDPGDWVGDGKRYSGSGPTSVKLYAWTDETYLRLDILDSKNALEWDAEFKAPEGLWLEPGLYNSAQRYPFQSGGAPGMSVWGGCNTVTGKFSIEELQRDPGTGYVRVQVIFEQHCDGNAPALRGVINFQAAGTPDPTPTPTRVIPLTGKVLTVAHDEATDLTFALDPTNRKITRIDLATGTLTTSSVLQIPNAACVDAKRNRLFVVNKGSTSISEYDGTTLAPVREITWSGKDWDAAETRYKIYCTANRLYVVDGAWAPALFTIDGLDGATPQVTDRTALVAGVGGIALGATGADLYYWYQYGWSAGSLSSYVRRVDTTQFAQIDKTAGTLTDFGREPLTAPVLLDSTRGLVFAKNRIFDAANLTRVVYSLPSTYDTWDGSSENAYALDAARGLMATQTFIYELQGYSVVAAALSPPADQLFFDKSGALWFLSTTTNTLKSQTIKR